MLKKAEMTRKRIKRAFGPKPRKVRRRSKAVAKGCLPPMNYVMEEHLELQDSAC